MSPQSATGSKVGVPHGDAGWRRATPQSAATAVSVQSGFGSFPTWPAAQPTGISLPGSLL